MVWHFFVLQEESVVGFFGFCVVCVYSGYLGVRWVKFPAGIALQHCSLPTCIRVLEDSCLNAVVDESQGLTGTITLSWACSSFVEHESSPSF